MKTTINGQTVIFEATEAESAVEVIRERARLTGTKLVCGTGVCGACTVLVNSLPMTSCLLPAHHLEGCQVQTIEAHGRTNLHPVQRAFMACDALQCGFCTPGFINEGIAFYDCWRVKHGTQQPTRQQIAEAMAGHLCRCGAYVGIYEALQKACTGVFDHPDSMVSLRHEAIEKVTGEAKYTVDLHLESQLEGCLLRSPRPHARILSIDASKALAMDGVKACVELLDTTRLVRYVGQPIAAIAAVDRRTAEAALRSIDVT
jgi:xanthine dehydrogenase YagR molybdenum-binding subunit